MSDGRRTTLRGAAVAEIEEKRSVFIAYAAPVRNEDEAHAIIEEKKKEYADATHNVWAYYIDGGARARCSDDGEPQGTAGMPTLNVLKMSGGTDMCVVVTRYFGGTLLGAGGLVRAYSAAAKAAIEKAGLAACEQFELFDIHLGYSDYGKLTSQLPALGISEDGADFGEDVCVHAAIEKSRADVLTSFVRELTNGKSEAVSVGFEERPSAVQP